LNTYNKLTRIKNSILPVDWISLALKPCQKSAEMAGKRDKEKINRMHFLGLLPEFSPREVNGPVATQIISTGVKFVNKMRFLGLLIFLGIYVYSFFFEFFD